MSEKKTVGRGRGALLDLLQKHKEARAGGAGEPAEEALPPKSRGRAALLHKLQEQKEKKAGEASGGSVSTPVVPSSRSGPPTIEKGLSELSLTTATETVSFAGSVGKSIQATANYIRLDIEGDRGVFEYEVRFQPEIDARSNRIRLVNDALGPLATTKVYDGDVCLYLPSLLITDRKEFPGVIPHTDQPVKTILIYKRKKKLSECLHLYNVLFKRIMNILLYKRMGRNYFSPDHKQLVPQHKLELLPGFAVHVDEMEGGLMICLDTQHRVIRSQTVLDLFGEIRAANPRQFKEEAMKNIVGACVLTKYNNKTYTVDDIHWEMTPRDSFEARSGGNITFVDYYRENHNIKIDDLEQPMLINRQARTMNGQKVEHMVCLVPELCYLTGLSDAMRSDFKVMKDVAAYTRVTPNQRSLALRTYLERVRGSELAQKVLSGWGLKLADATTDLNARVLPPETIFFGGPPGKEGRNKKDTTDWNHDIFNNKITGPIDIIRWQLYYTKANQKLASDFSENCMRLGRNVGCVIREPKHVVLESDRGDVFMNAIRNNITDEVQVAVFIVPTIRADRYSTIKKMCCVNHPIASQVIVAKTLSNPSKVRTIIHKIILQITCKLGGTLWSLNIPVTDWMTCGIDVYHGAKKESVCAFVASINGNMTRYYSESVFQLGEIGDFFKMVFRKSLMQYRTAIGNFPKKVIIFRDGVGDGQLDHCKRYEVSQFEAVLRELNLDTGVTFVVVQKRINTRIFQVKENTHENPPSGTVVDSIVTRRNMADFFLVPQKVTQGTVNPTHYIVLHNGGEIKPDHLQRLAYKMCHLYYNWSGTIRVPAPCMYAHKLAALVGQYVRTAPAAELADKLYYL